MAEDKELTQPLKDVASAIENEDIVSSVQKRLDETLGNISAEDLKDVEDSTPDDQDDKKDDQADDSKSKDDSTPDDKPEDKKDKDDTGDTDGDENKDAPSESDDKVDKETDDKTDKKFELPDAFHRAAEHDGWKPEDIKGFFEADPERALVTFQNIYTSMNRASKEFANLGRIKAEQTRKQVEDTAKVDDKIEIKDFVNIEKLKEDYEDTALIDGVVKPLNEALKQVSQEIKSLKSQKSSSADDIAFAKTDQIAATQRAEATAKQADMKLIEQFFTAEDMKSYKDFYGTIGMGQIFQDLQPGQQKNRYEMLQIADQMVVGNAIQGIELSVPDALLRAHLLVTESIREKVIREEIKSSLTKRNKGLTLRPSAGKKSAAAVSEGGKPKNRAEVIANAERNLAKTFGN